MDAFYGKSAGSNQKIQSVSSLSLSKSVAAVRRGEFICIVGSSGCGKSTLLSVLSAYTL
ncbi:MAG: ATP-binding cassette domain-containing protein [Treponema sp.]|nr:ATP-binding cassette domain-containing protein [Treponema sp.]